MSAFTSGPWEPYIGNDGQFQDEPRILAPRRNAPDVCIAILCDNGSQETDANARAIAALPALYEASTELLAVAERPGIEWSAEWADMYEERLQALRVAIARIRGAA